MFLKTETVILIVVTYGAGMGHLVRELSIAKAIRRQDASTMILFLSTSLVSHYIKEDGFYYYYVPDKMIAKEYLTNESWEKLFYDTFDEIMRLHKPSLVIFDGAYPPIGMIQYKAKNKDSTYIWVKREGDRKGTERVSDYEQFFEFLIVPREIAGKNRESNMHCKVVEPIIYEPEEIASWEQMQSLFPYHPIVSYTIWYIQLGAGVDRESDFLYQKVVDMLLEDPNRLVLIGDSPCNKKRFKKQYKTSRISVIEHFPNSSYFDQISYAVSAAGYNTYYELLYYEVPAIFLPNHYLKKDDQEARAKRSESLGTGIARSRTSLGQSDFYYIEQQGKRMKQQCQKNKFVNGADQAALFILKTIHK